ncbi:hypothetical protein L1987_56299 [Smallanthus sonchifolius]|uniref:Uncharacterized protein n=1 Tax=Smallanthus sonchifolius TaxID=185202 RepID=A0ACB9ED27_9ASTR|nr:hypothetical protein L1987_56299 [Smallanthus sonchifolius]
MILVNQDWDGDSTHAEAHVLPASHVGYKQGFAIKTYISSTASPTATLLFQGTIIGVDSAPAVASFSSRGPSLQSPGILKPDIIGRCVSVLAAWHSPTVIKSTIMITADQVSLNGKPIKDERELHAGIYAIGSGHVNPSKAKDLGLVYDIEPDDYIPYLCGLGYTSQQVGIIVTRMISCTKTIPEGQLNYPSYTMTLTRGENKTYSRTVTNVGEANSTYTFSELDTVVPNGAMAWRSGLDLAVEDGVDVLSLSLGGLSHPYYQDGIVIGAFTAIQKGIFVACAAANRGPSNTMLSNEAPWILTVGASTIDRKIVASVSLGNKVVLEGESLFQPKDFPKHICLWCTPGRTAIDGDSTFPDVHVLPTSHVGYKEGVAIKTYISSTEFPTATLLFRGTVIRIDSAPAVTYFSSRGPSMQSPGILKPDIITLVLAF